MTLFLYFARRFLFRFSAVFAVFLGLMVLTEATSLLGKFGSARIGFLDLLRLAVLRAPTGVYQLMPFIAILASLALYLGLGRSSELVATRAAGQSGMATLAGPVLVAFVIGLAATAAFNPFAAATLSQYEAETGRYKSGTLSTFSLSRKGLWLRQGTTEGQTVIFAESANFNATRLIGVTFFEFDASGLVRRRIESEFALLRTGFWQLGPGMYWDMTGIRDVPDRAMTRFEALKVQSNLTSDQILDSFGDPNTISIWDTPDFIAKLEASGFATLRHRVHFHTEIAAPVMLVAMVLLGAALSMRHGRASGRGLMILFTVMMGLGAYILQDFAEILGSNGAIPALAAAWGPPASAALFALGLILHMEDG